MGSSRVWGCYRPARRVPSLRGACRQARPVSSPAHHADWLALGFRIQALAVEMDCVEGRKACKAILALHFVRSEFQAFHPASRGARCRQT